MQVGKNTVVGIDYTLTNDEGKVIDSSDGREPLAYLHGAGGIIPGLERELDGKQVGDQLDIAVAPADGYGERDANLQQQVSREQFEGVEELELGMQFRVSTDNGHMVFTVIEIADDIVTVDGNHPLAGINLNFAVKVREVREASEEEISHGHAHGPGGHSH